MTISADMTDDADFLAKLKNSTYQLAVTHFAPEGPDFYCKKIGHESLYISLMPGNPLAFYPEVHLKDLDGLTILLLSRIGFLGAKIRLRDFLGTMRSFPQAQKRKHPDVLRRFTP